MLISEGLYKPTPASNSTNQGEFIQFNGASEDGTAPASVSREPVYLSVLERAHGYMRIRWHWQETFTFIHDDVTYDGVNLKGFLVGNITDGSPLPGDGCVPDPFFVTSGKAQMWSFVLPASLA